MGTKKTVMNIFVTGGGGFLGKEIVRKLIAKNYRVRSYSRKKYPELEKMGAEHFQGDLASLTDLKAALEDQDAVIHVAALAGIWGKYQDFYQANVVGTQNVITACREKGIRKLVYTSTPSVIYHKKGIEGSDETIPYPNEFEAYYPQTKAIAEKMILQANDANLATVALRPHLIWGPGDHHFLPRLVSKARSGKLRLLGKEKNLVDSVYIDNAAKAHLLALEKLTPGSPVAGKAYFITQDEPIPIADLINKILQAAGAPTVEKTRTINPQLAFVAGAILENLYSFLGIKSEPPMTRFMARQLSTPHWFDISAAKRDLGYEPEISLEEGMKRLSNWLNEQN